MTITMKQLAELDEDYAKKLFELAKTENVVYEKILEMTLDEFLDFAANILSAKLEVLERCQKKQ